MTSPPGEREAKVRIYLHGPGDHRAMLIQAWSRAVSIPADDAGWTNALALTDRWQAPRLPIKGADVLPARDQARTPDPKPVKKRAGEYGSGPGTQRTVDKAKLREVKQERAKDKRAR